ncbi:hypothetical protein KEG38_33700 [Polyangium jinanense]|uniref:hypothetical protein n=1 Tax=Polyangium jinanense TaxID=2829994 RepID=UPI002340BF33|nr:hypothetical protein [Polyangium jinanense]MDC3958860.1 hypothetical protein [Polyangium jinanense]
MDLREDARARLERLPRSQRADIVQACLQIGRAAEYPLEGRPFLVPLELDAAHAKNAFRQVECLVRALVRLEHHARGRGGEALLQRLRSSLEEGSDRLVRQCTFESADSVEHRLRRVDTFLDPASGRCTAIEVNQAAPLGLHYHDVDQRMAASFLGALGIPYEPRLLAPHVVEWLFDEYCARYPGRIPRRIALVSEHGYAGKREVPHVAREYQRAARERYGEHVDIVFCYPPEVKLASGRPTVGGAEVDMIWRYSVYLDTYHERGIDVTDYEAVYAHPEEHLIVNSTGAFLTASKETFVLLGDASVVAALGLAPEEVALLRETVPDTVNLTFDPARRREVVEEREGWISKPTDSSFGEGVVFGVALSRGEWERLVEERTQAGFLFQRRVEYPVVPALEIAEDGSLLERNIEIDFCPFHVGGRVPGPTILRAHVVEPGQRGTRIMNTRAGAFMVPFLAPPRAETPQDRSR